MTAHSNAPPQSKTELENEGPLTPKFDDKGLITAIAQDAADDQIVMLAHMNDEALARTIETGIAHYYSRSRQTLWKKGETSGNVQKVVSIHVDCDQDAVLLKVDIKGDGTACHTGRKSCFYRKVDISNGASTPQLVIDE